MQGFLGCGLLGNGLGVRPAPPIGPRLESVAFSEGVVYLTFDQPIAGVAGGPGEAIDPQIVGHDRWTEETPLYQLWAIIGNTAICEFRKDNGFGFVQSLYPYQVEIKAGATAIVGANGLPLEPALVACPVVVAMVIGGTEWEFNDVITGCDGVPSGLGVADSPTGPRYPATSGVADTGNLLVTLPPEAVANNWWVSDQGPGAALTFAHGGALMLPQGGEVTV